MFKKYFTKKIVQIVLTRIFLVVAYWHSMFNYTIVLTKNRKRIAKKRIKNFEAD